jgi:UDP-N-acetylglucosamine 4-epimerase
MNVYESLREKLSVRPKVWLVTGAAGFIGPALLEDLLLLNQRMVGMDNFLKGIIKGGI